MKTTFSFFCVESDTFGNHIVALETSHMKRCLVANHEDALIDLLRSYSEWMRVLELIQGALLVSAISAIKENELAIL